MLWFRTLFALLLAALSFGAHAYNDTGAFYRNEATQVLPGRSCGSLCLSNPNYYEGYLYQQERNQRVVNLEVQKNRKLIRKKTGGLSYKEISRLDWVRGLVWGPDTKVSKFFSRQSVRWSRVARDAGFQVAERGKSLHSALWREVRKPILYSLRDRLRAPYRAKKLSLKDKIRVWLLEQAVDTGASTLNLDSTVGEQGRSANTDFGISNTLLKFNPHLDPYKGRYGIRLKAKRHVRRNRPLQVALTANYCNSTAGFGDRICAYEYEFSSSVAFINPTNRWSSSAYVSYRRESLDEDYYIVDGQAFDHKPWLAGMTITYAFY